MTRSISGVPRAARRRRRRYAGGLRDDARSARRRSSSRAARSAEGLAALEMFVPQVILCDIAMPGEDGYAFIRKLRSGNRGEETFPPPRSPLWQARKTAGRALESGFQMHLAKPIDADRLATAVATLVAPIASR